jgi:hypothetical protein
MRPAKRSGDLEAARVNAGALILPWIRMRRGKRRMAALRDRSGNALRRKGLRASQKRGVGVYSRVAEAGITVMGSSTTEMGEQS